ncbi:MAG: DUF4910 domain-containing protein [Alphaproteobacteria bacterium]|nr:DUF4910 domain-containing protein [Alphaproteobacteria bacterium]
MFEQFSSDRALLDRAFDDLFPIMRSITGPGIEQSIDYFRQFMPLEMQKVPTGSQVFDWTVPQEWHFARATLHGPDGELVCDTDHHTLHVVNYSEPIDATFTLEELEPHLHSLPDLPDAIPYVTSYYKRTWGFCLAHNVREKLKPGNYRVQISAEFKDGGVPYATCVLPGESDREIMLTSYLCHPSLANNELSGPLVLLALYRRIMNWEKRRHSFRFVLNPETIGSLCFLHHYADHLRDKLEAGIILTCVGGDAPSLRYKSSRRGDTHLDQLMARFGEGRETTPMPLRVEGFSPLGGSDERQYCAPGFNLPVGQIARSVYGDGYVGYHNSLDTKEFMNIDALIETTDTVEHALKLLDISTRPVNQAPFGEPQLGKRGLYPNMNAAATRKQSDDSLVDGRTQLNRLLTVLNMADGHTDTMKIADACGCSLSDLQPTIVKLEQEGLLKFNSEPLVQ